MQGFDEKEYKSAFSLKAWKTMLPFMKPYRVILLVVLVANIFCAGIDVLLPLFQREAINRFIAQSTTQGLVPFALMYAGTILLQTLSLYIFTRGSMRIEMHIARDLRRACFEQLQTLSLSYYNVTPVGYILSRCMNDVGRITGLIAWEMFDIVWALSYVLGIMAAMLMLDVQLALIVIAIVPVLAVLTGVFQNKILFWRRKVRKNHSRITGVYNEGIMGAKTAKTLVIEDKTSEEFAQVTEQMRKSSITAARWNAVYIPLIVLMGAIATAAVLWRGGLITLDQAMEIGTLTAFGTYAIGIFEPIQNLARQLSEFISAQTNIERIDGILSEKPMVSDTPEVIEKYGDAFAPKRENWEEIRGDIEFDDVTFHYPDGKENVLEHFNLKIPAGTTVAIVGETGAGKSTLVNLACRFFEPTQGTIRIDGRDYRERSQLWLHSAIGYVLQSPHLFSGTIMENIRYGRLSATDEEVITAAKAVSADTVVSKLENGYQSDVGEGGDRLSTGEKQLISFARAVLCDPRIFVLDEATSSIDTQTEQLIQEAVEYLLKDRTSFLIAHRLSTIRHADMILVVDGGRIVEQGRHEELLGAKGHYYRLYQKQFAEEAARQVLQ